MDTKRPRKKSVTNENPDPLVIKIMFCLRFKLLTFMNTIHDLICNQVKQNLKNIHVV